LREGGAREVSSGPWLGPEENMGLVVTALVMDGYASSVITEVGSRRGSKQKPKRFRFSANGTVAWLLENLLAM
jgi:hypothetical protein